MKVLISGSTGFIGSALVSYFRAQGHEVKRLVRKKDNLSDDETGWDPHLGPPDLSAWEGYDVVVHLEGENVASGRWTEAKKKEIRESRVASTRTLSHFLSQLKQPPKVFLTASAMGYYGDQGSTVLTEANPSGRSFLATVCQEWEEATEEAAAAGIRVAHTRFGMVLSSKGGGLPKLMIPYRLGLGGVVGSGEQYISWVTLDDLLAMILHVIGNDRLSNGINFSTPYPVTNAEFTKVLGKVLECPTFVWLPAAMARLTFGEMADEMMLCSTRMVPQKLIETGFSFRYPQLEEALKHIVNDKA